MSLLGIEAVGSAGRYGKNVFEFFISPTWATNSTQNDIVSFVVCLEIVENFVAESIRIYGHFICMFLILSGIVNKYGEKT